MKIGVFSDQYNPTISGMVTSINMLEQEMKKRGHEVYVFAPSKSIQTKENQSLYTLKSVPFIVAKQYKNRLAAFYSRDIAKKIKEIGLDIVHTQSEFSLGLFGKIISRKFDIPFIHTYHTLWEDYVHYIMPIKGTRNIYTKRFARVISKNFVTKAECIIAPSKKAEKYLRYKCKVKNKPIYIIPTGIDILPFARENFSLDERNKLKDSLGISKDDKVIIFIGRIAEEKSIDIIMNSMPSVFTANPNTKFLLIGDGPCKVALQTQAKNLNISDKVIFTGNVLWASIPKYLSIADVFVNASVTETQGLTFMEAMAAKVPIVARYAPNLSEFIIHNKNGILVKHEADFSKFVLSVINNETLSQKFSDNAYETAQKYSIEEFGDKLELVYTEIINNYKLKKTLTKQEKHKQNRAIYKRITDKLLKITKLRK
ncbi:MAG: glycosyltransferase [Clostridia bacterium]